MMLILFQETAREGCRTDVARQDQEVIVSQCSVFVGVKQRINIQAISRWILVQDLHGLGVVQDFSLGVEKPTGIAIGDSHREKG